MNQAVKNLHAPFYADSGVKPCDKKAFSVVEAKAPEPASFTSSAPRQRYAYPYTNGKQRYRSPALLKSWQVDNLHLADKHAKQIGMHLNTFISILWLATEHQDIDAAAFTKSMKRMAAWLRRRGVQPTYVYVHENPVSKGGDSVPNSPICSYTFQNASCPPSRPMQRGGLMPPWTGQ